MLGRRARSLIAMFLVATAMVATGVPAAGQSASHQAVNLSFVYPLSTNRTPDVSASFRLSLLYGRLHTIRGLDLNAGASLLHGDLHGVQLTGAYSQIEGDVEGVTMSLGPTYVRGSMTGAQVAWAPNVVSGDFAGFQYSWMANVLAGDLHGAQVSALFNLSDGGGGFLQLSAAANAVAHDFEGAQISAFLNYGRSSVRGLQLSMANLADEGHGVQVGAINMARVHHGLRVGALNLTHDDQGIPIGLVNISETNGDVSWVTFVSNYALLNTGVLTTVNNVYSMLTLGWNDLVEDYSDTAFLTWNFGYEQFLSPEWKLGADLGWVHVMPKGCDDPQVNDDLHFAVQLRVRGTYQASEKVGLFAAAGVSDIFSEYGSGAKGQVEPLVAAGIILF